MSFKTSAERRAQNRIANRRWRRRQRESYLAATRKYVRNNREARRIRCKAWRDAQRAKDPNFATQAAKAYRAANPNYTREWYYRRKLRLAWQKFAKACAAGRKSLQDAYV